MPPVFMENQSLQCWPPTLSAHTRCTRDQPLRIYPQPPRPRPPVFTTTPAQGKIVWLPQESSEAHSWPYPSSMHGLSFSIHEMEHASHTQQSPVLGQEVGQRVSQLPAGSCGHKALREFPPPSAYRRRGGVLHHQPCGAAPAPPPLGPHRPEREGRPPREDPRSSTMLGGLQGQGLCRQGLGLS